jgi:acyl-CoA reductase-like NAD-dependent aldehyde dehydrogenase
LADLVEKNRDYFIKLEGWNTGRPKAVNELDFSDSVKFMRFFAGLADKIFGKTFTGIPTHVIYTRKEPIGVVALISPWNFPFMMCIWKMMPAIAAGNCVISKPSEITPLSQLFLGQLIKEAGFPPGVINILPGYG